MKSLGFHIIYSLIIFIVAAGASQCEPSVALPTASAKPLVSLISPPGNATLALNEAVPVRALIKDSTGVLRVDFVVDGVIVDSQSLVFASFQYDYQYSWKPILLGAHNVSVIGYNSNGIVSDPVSVRVNVVASAIQKTQTPTSTPVFVVITPAGTMTGTPIWTFTRTWTPRLVVVTQTPLPTGTPTQTATSSRTPFIIVVTDTPALKTPTITTSPTK